MSNVFFDKSPILAYLHQSYINKNNKMKKLLIFRLEHATKRFVHSLFSLKCNFTSNKCFYITFNVHIYLMSVWCDDVFKFCTVYTYCGWLWCFVDVMPRLDVKSHLCKHAHKLFVRIINTKPTYTYYRKPKTVCVT